MPSTPSIFSPVMLSRTWLDVFEALDQWEDVNKFYVHHSRELNTVQGHRHLCLPKVGHLMALCTRVVQLVHHIHQEDVDDFHGNGALTEAGGTASMMLVIGTRSAYNRLTGNVNSWSTMTTRKTKKDVIASPDNAKTVKPNDASKPPAAAKRNTPTGTERSRHSSSAMTQKMKAYKQSIAPKASDDDDDEEVNDKNIDPGEPKVNKMGVVVPNMLPIPAFMVAALIMTYTSDAAILCLAAIDAIKERATKAGEDPLLSQNARRAAYVSKACRSDQSPTLERMNGPGAAIISSTMRNEL